MSSERKVCPICGKSITKHNFSNHVKIHERDGVDIGKYSYALNHDGLACQFCGKECKNRNSLCNHERLCKLNPNRQEIDYNGRKRRSGVVGKTPWNKGLTASTDERVKRQTDNMKATIERKKSNGLVISTGKGATKEIEDIRKSKLRQVALNRGFGGMNRNKNSIVYNGVKLNSTYELTVAMSLDSNNIDWEKPKRLQYIDNIGKYHTYTADFYLPRYDVYLDPKNDFLINETNPALGFTDVQKIQWAMEQNGVVVLILTKDELSWESIEKKIQSKKERR